jgi:two-component system NtrC family sensor kinase
MKDFFTWQMDYVYFFYGLASVALAIVCYVMMRKKPPSPLPWIWLALFGLFHGGHEWLEVIGRGPWDNRLIYASHVLLMAVSYVFLLEFGRAGVKEISGKEPGRWIFFPLLSLAFLGGLAGLDGFDAAARYSLGLTGGLLASRALFHASGRLGKEAGRWVVVCGTAAGLYALATGIGVPQASFVPASVVNRDIFFQTLGVPVQFIRGICLTVMASSIWVGSQVLSRETAAITRARGAFRPALIVIAVVIAGWGITEFSGNVARQEEMREGRLTLDALRNYFFAAVGGATHDVTEKALRPEVRAALVSGRSAEIASVRMSLGCEGSHQDPRSYLIDSKGGAVAGCREEASSSEMSLKGKRYILQEALSGRTRGNYFFDSLTRAWSYYAFADVRDAGGRVIGAVISERKLEGVEETFRKYPFCFLIDPHGVVFISSKEKFCLKSLWPLSADARKTLADSGQFGPGPFSPLMSGEAVDGNFVTLEGQDLLVSRQFIDDNGWSLVLLSPTGRIKAYRFFAIFTIFVFCGVTVGFFALLYFTRESAAQILASERRHRSLVEGSPNCVMLFDRECRCVAINRAGLDMIGCREEEIVGRRFGMFKALGDTGRRIDQLFMDVLQGNKLSFEAEGVRSDGRRVICSAVLNPVPDADGQIRSFVGIFMDITERKAAEDKLHIYHEHLEEMVKERTAELSGMNKRLEQEIAERRTAEEELKRHREHLTELVKEQTADLIVANDFLQQEIKERKRSEEELRTFSRRIETIINSSSDFIVMKDRDFRFLVVNKECAKYFNAPVQDIMGKTDFDFMDAAAAKACRRSDEAALEADAPTSSEELIGERWLHIVKQKVLDAEGNVSGIVAVMRDISDRKKSENDLRKYQEQLEEMVRDRTAELSEANLRLSQLNEALTNSEERFRSLFNLASDCILLIDAGGETPVIADANIAAGSMNGYAREELIGMPVIALDHEDSRRQLPGIIRQIMSGEAVTFEVNHVRKDGSVFPVEVSAQLIHLSGRPYILAVDRDITERRKAEEELKRHRGHLLEMVEERTVELKTAVQLLTNEINFRKMTEETLKESEAKFRTLSREFNTLLNSMPDTLILLSRDLSVKWANSSAASMFGRETSDVTGHHCFEMWYNRAEPCEDCFALRSFRSGNSESSQHATPSGRLLDGRAFPITGEDGTVNSVIVVLTDITEKTALQAEAMRASHLASLGELAAGVAHEINNPINGIINYAQILANKIAEGSKEHEISQRIIREGDRIAGIVRSLLSFARERKEDRVPVAMQRIMEDTITLTETQIRKEGIDLLIDIPDSLPEIVANPQQIQQVFLNVISNARYALNQKYPGTHADKKFVISGASVTVDDSAYVRVAFYDVGTGISADIIDKVMHPFFSTKPSGIGTGLGLSISHGIIQSHGGRLSLESAEGAYTKVTIDLPIKERHGK